MDQNYPFVRDDILPSFWANRIQDFVSSLGRFQLRQASANSVEVPAGPEDAAVSLSIERRWRFVEATVTRAHPGGGAGQYSVWVTAAENDITNAPDPFTDNTDYAFDLAITADGVPPAAVPGTVDIWREVGKVQWSGAAITKVTPLLGPQPALHASSHASGGADPIAPADIGAQPVDATLTAVAGSNPIADRLIYWTGVDAAALTPFSAAARALVDDADASAMLTTLGFTAFVKTLIDDVDATAARATLGVSIGSAVQAWSAALDQWAAKARPAGAVVGDTDAQTLTAKTIQNPLIEGTRNATAQKNANYTVVANDQVIPVDAAGGARTITLPPQATYPGKIVTVKKIDASANAVTIDADAAETIDGALTYVLRTQYETVTLMAGVAGGWGVIACTGRRPIGAFHASRVAALSIATVVVVVFDTEAFDLDGWYDPSNGRYTPQRRGYYELHSELAIKAGELADQGQFFHALQKNGATVKNLGHQSVSGGGATPVCVIGSSGPIFANGTTDYFQITQLHTKGSNAAFEVNGTHNWFGGNFLGPDLGAY